MGTQWGFEIGLIIALLGLSALFSLCESSMTSINRLRLKSLKDDGVKGADTLVGVLENPDKMFSTVLIGGNAVDIFLTSIVTAMAIRYFGNYGLVLLVATLGVTVLIILFGEILPKTVALLYSESIGLKLAGTVKLLTLAFTPLVAVLNGVNRLMLKMLRINIDISKDTVTEQDMRAMIDIGHEQGVIEEESRDMFASVFEFALIQAFDVCTPRTDISAIPINSTVDEVHATFDRDKYSRLPVYEDSIDNIVGIIHVKDFAFSDHKNNPKWIYDIMRKPLLTYDSQPIGRLFAAMREQRAPFAVVLDEYGGTSGIVTMEDIVARIVGVMVDEYEDVEYAAKPVNENEFIVAGSAMLENANSIMGTELSSDEFESVGGYVIGKLGRIPEVGDVVEEAGLSFTVTSMERNRIIEIRIKKIEETKETKETKET